MHRHCSPRRGWIRHHPTSSHLVHGRMQCLNNRCWQCLGHVANAAADTAVWAMEVATDGSLSGRRAFAELFRADGRYRAAGLAKTVASQAEEMAVDARGRLYVGTRFGVQVFDAAGALLGIVNFPELPISFTPKPPRSCALGGDRLYVACDDEIFAVPLDFE